MKLSDILREELSKRNLTSYKEAARFLGLSPKLLGTIMRGGHLPKQKNLIKIAERLGIEASVLIFDAQKQLLPPDLQAYLLKPTDVPPKHKRIWPLSHEQCDYLARIMRPEEIQLIRKYRQFAYEAKVETRGFIHYMFSTQRVPPPADKDDQQSRGIDLGLKRYVLHVAPGR
jgi:transcriptional regulator with XRE-family HTH domain